MDTLPNGRQLTYGEYRDASRPLKRFLKQLGSGSLEAGLAFVLQHEDAQTSISQLIGIDKQVWNPAGGPQPWTIQKTWQRVGPYPVPTRIGHLVPCLCQSQPSTVLQSSGQACSFLPGAAELHHCVPEFRVLPSCNYMTSSLSEANTFLSVLRTSSSLTVRTITACMLCSLLSRIWSTETASPSRTSSAPWPPHILEMDPTTWSVHLHHPVTAHSFPTCPVWPSSVP